MEVCSTAHFHQPLFTLKQSVHLPPFLFIVEEQIPLDKVVNPALGQSAMYSQLVLDMPEERLQCICRLRKSGVFNVGEQIWQGSLEVYVRFPQIVADVICLR